MKDFVKLAFPVLMASILLTIALYYSSTYRVSIFTDPVYMEEISGIQDQLDEIKYEMEYRKYTDSMEVIYKGLSPEIIKSIKLKIEDTSPISIAEEYLSKKQLYDCIGTKDSGIKKVNQEKTDRH